MPIDNRQASLAVQFAVQDTGRFGAGVPLRMFAYQQSSWNNLDWIKADGRTLPTSGNAALLSQLGTNYGGNGITNFAVPDLRGRTPIGEASSVNLGQLNGSSEVTMSVAQMPAHQHTHPSAVGGATSVAGAGAPIDNRQSSLSLNWSIETAGIFPNTGVYALDNGVIGRLVPLAAVPSNFPDRIAADGRSLTTSGNTPLFSQISTTYGSASGSTFNVPNLQGRVGRGTTAFEPLGSTSGSNDLSLTQVEMPAHAHGVAGVGVGPTGTSGLGLPVDNRQSGLGIQYGIVATGGAFPFSTMREDAVYLGEIQAFANNSLPAGYVPADGRLLPTASYAALFNLLGNAYGGDGFTTFAVPDLRGRVPIGASDALPAGSFVGADEYTLIAANLPAHTHTFTGVPEPTTLLVLASAGGAGLRRPSRRRRVA